MPLFRKTSVPTIFQPSARELRIAASQGDTDKVAELIKSGAKSLPDKDGRTPLHLAVVGGHSESVELLLRCGQDPDTPDRLGYSPLHRAAMDGDVEVCRLLLEAGGSLAKVDFVQENTPLHEAAAKGHAKAVKMLLYGGADVYQRNRAGATALHLAAQHGQTSCLKLLLKTSMKPNPVDKYDDTPLHTAVRYLHGGAAQLLLAFGATPNEKNRNGDTPLALAVNLGQRRLSRILIQAGASVSTRNNQGETPLAIAVRKQNQELIDIVKGTKKVEVSSSKTNKRSGQQWSKGNRQSKIRERLKAAKETESKWQLLFQDWPVLKQDDPRTWNYTQDINLNSEFPPLRSGEQYFVDLGGNVKTGPAGSGKNCYCAPYLCHLAKHNTDANQELIEEIDACHDDLSHEISDLRHVTKCYFSDLRRRLRQKRKARRRNSGERGPPPSKGGRGLLIRSRSESELETDVESKRLVEAKSEHSDSISNASEEDLYTEEYWKSFSSSQESQRSAKRGRKPLLGSIQETLQETVMEFNRLSLDDTCTTPTSASSQAYSADRSRCHNCRSSVGTSDSPPEPSTEEESRKIDATIYACQWEASNCPQPPSLDSGYGTGASPSPALRNPSSSVSSPNFPRSISDQPLVEMGTQTEEESHIYTELEAPLLPPKPRTRFANRKPMLTIPPPPRHPLPPLPQNKSGITTNV